MGYEELQQAQAKRAELDAARAKPATRKRGRKRKQTTGELNTDSATEAPRRATQVGAAQRSTQAETGTCTAPRARMY